jgi:hypothetical protein
MASNCLSDRALNPLTTFLFAVLLLFGASDVYGRPPSANHPAKAPSAKAANQPFLREYALGVQRIPMDGGKMYGWKLNDKVTFGRFKGENDEFGFSVELNARQRVEITTDGLRWRKAIGGGPR